MLTKLKKYWFPVFAIISGISSFYRSFHTHREANKNETHQKTLSALHEDIAKEDMEMLLNMQEQIFIFCENAGVQIANAYKKYKDLFPLCICEHKDIFASMHKIQETIQAINEIEHKLEYLFNPKNLVEDFQSLDAPLKQAFIDGWENEAKEFEPLFTNFVINLKQLVLEVESLLNYLSQEIGSYHFWQGKIIFNNTNNVQIYNKFLQNISDLSASLEQKRILMLKKEKSRTLEQ